MSHLDRDALADLLAGTAPAADGEHAAGCPRCSAGLTRLERDCAAVSRRLAALPPPVLPSDVGRRLDAALRGEQRAVVPIAGRRRRPPGPLLAAAAVVAVLGLGGAAVALVQRPSDQSAKSSAGAATAESTVPAPRLTRSGRDYAGPEAIEQALPRLLAGAAAGVPEGDVAPPQLADCLAPLGSPAPLVVDSARFRGSPALVVVVPAAGPAQLDVYVLDPDCSAPGQHVRYRFRLPRPSPGG